MTTLPGNIPSDLGRITWRDRAGYVGARTLSTLIHGMPVSTALSVADGVGDGYRRIFPKYQRRAESQIRWALPHLPDRRIREIAKRSMMNLFRLGVEMLIGTRQIHLDSWSRHVTIDGIAYPLRLLLSDRPAILVTGHLGNWEITGTLLATWGIPVTALARPIDNPLINRWLFGLRERRGLEILTKWGATHRMTRLMRDGGNLAFIADQNAGNSGLFVPFFGKLASTYKSIGLLAMRYDAPIICGGAMRTYEGFGFRWVVADVIEPDDWADVPDPLYYITARYVRALESMVREHPDQYVWTHRRWRSRPRHERTGEPIPSTLRGKLEALPWINDERLARLGEPGEPLPE